MESQKLPTNQPLPEPNSNPTQNQNPYTVLPTQPKLTDTDAQALLTVNNLQGRQPPKHSNWYVVAIVALALVLAATALYTHSNHTAKNNSKTSNSSVSLPNSSNPLTNNGTVNQQVKYCSNVINASTVC